MPRMIPTVPRFGANKSERTLFTAFEGLADYPDWVVYHSLAIRQHVSQLQGEADFVVVVPRKGILVIEAKAPSSVSYNDGTWYLEKVPSPEKNPFRQLDGAIASIRKYLLHEGAITPSVPFARLVWFTSIGRSHFDARSTPEDLSFFEWELAWADDARRPSETILHALDEHHAWFSGARGVMCNPEELTPARCQKITAALMKDFSVAADESDALREAENLAGIALAEQRFALEIVEANRAVYFDGPAGTGKSYLAVQAALDSMKRGERTLLTCWNLEMAARLKEAVSPLRGPIAVLDIATVMLRMAGLEVHPEGAGGQWYQEELPRLALRGIGDHPKSGGYKAIIIDEFQDIAGNPALLDVVEALGTPQSRFMFAGDKRQQIMRSDVEHVDPYAVMKERMPDLVRARIRRNCRQSPQLVAANEQVLGSQCGFTAYRMPRSTPGTHSVHVVTQEDRVRILAHTLRELSARFGNDGIAVLSPWGKRSLSSRILAGEDVGGSPRDLEWIRAELGDEKGTIRCGSISKLKGIEKEGIVLTDIGEAGKRWAANHGLSWDDLLYVALSRAKYQVVTLEEK